MTTVPTVETEVLIVGSGPVGASADATRNDAGPICADSTDYPLKDVQSDVVWRAH